MEHEAGRLVPDLFLLFEKASFDVKASGQQLSLMSFDIPIFLNLAYSKKTNCIKI